jgi:hypothetical protein
MASGSTSRNWDEFHRKERVRRQRGGEEAGASVDLEQLAEARTALLNGFLWLSEEVYDSLGKARSRGYRYRMKLRQQFGVSSRSEAWTIGEIRVALERSGEESAAYGARVPSGHYTWLLRPF